METITKKLPINSCKPNHSATRINALAKEHDAKNYLEIGVCKGETFFAVDMPNKLAVDPDFAFDPREHEASGVYFFSETSDNFFSTLTEKSRNIPGLTSAWHRENPTFDIIFIDGLHTFEQSFRDFEQSLRFAHANTIWLLDDTVPCDPFSAIPDQQKSYVLREYAGIAGKPWHGDVFKTVFALHDRYLEFSYCTLMGNNPQTVVWRHPQDGGKPRLPVFSSLEDIARLDYFGMLDHAVLLAPVNDDMLQRLIGKTLNTQEYSDADTWKKLVYNKMLTIDILNATFQLNEYLKTAQKAVAMERESMQKRLEDIQKTVATELANIKKYLKGK